MQKKIIALAVAGLVSGAAFAQSNVTVYGVADVGYTYSESKTGLPAGGKYKFSGLKDGADNGLNGSRIGFKGEEGLGNGLKAIFVTELRVQAVNGDQTGVSRQIFVGLNSTTLGTLTAGRQYSAAGDLVGNNSSNSAVGVMPYNTFQGAGGQQIVSAGGNSRQSNAIKYVSPNFAGFTGRLSYAFSDNTRTSSSGFDTNADTTDNGRVAASLDYLNGPINVDLIYAKTSNAYTPYGGSPTAYTSAEGKDINEWYVGGSYDFKVVKAFGSYQNLKNNNSAQLAMTKSKLWQLGASVPVGAQGKVMLEYAKIDFDQDNQVSALQQNGGNKGWGIGYQHDLSKRTSLYALVSQLKYGANTATTNGLASGTPIAGVQATTNASGQSQNNITVGMRHFF